MKNLILFLFCIATAAFCSAQKLTMDKVPPAAANGFKVKFPNGSQPGWIKTGVDVYEVQFFNGKKRQSALFDNTGKWMQTQSEANYGAVPGKVQRAFETEFEGYQVQEVYETETPDKGLTYEITAFKGAKNFMVVYSSKGELLKKEEGINE
jgi:hypothetical protein